MGPELHPRERARARARALDAARRVLGGAVVDTLGAPQPLVRVGAAGRVAPEAERVEARDLADRGPARDRVGEAGRARARAGRRHT